MTTQQISARSRRARKGFTLVELMVALMVLSVGILGLASTATMVSRLVSGGGQQTIAANVAASRFEVMRGRQCADLAAGTATTRGMSEHWILNASGTTGIVSLVDTIRYTAAGGRTPKPLIFQSFVRCD